MITGALLTLLLLALSSLWAPTAQAGGPTSVLLAKPSTGQVVAYGYEDREYRRLREAIGNLSARPTLGPEVDRPYGGAFGNRVVRLTWLIHDMSVWRTDLLHPTPDGWFVETRLMTDRRRSDDWPAPTWHRPVDPGALAAVLAGAGVQGSGDASDSSGSPVRTAGSPDDEESATLMGGDGRTVLGLVGTGVAGGIIGVLGYRLASRRRLARNPGGSQPPDRIELIG